MHQLTMIVVFTESGPLLYSHNLWKVSKKPFLETEDTHRSRRSESTQETKTELPRDGIETKDVTLT